MQSLIKVAQRFFGQPGRNLGAALACAAALSSAGCTTEPSELVLIEDGLPQAQIVVAESPPRLVELAARELQHFLREMSGAELPIVTAPAESVPVSIYVGRSEFTDALGITDEGLEHGAYRVVAGPDYLVLLGHDADFAPNEPWPRRHQEYPATQAAWEELYGGPSANPLNVYSGPSTGFNKQVGIWKQDQGGSLQAVYDLLRTLGVRWFMPGELGEVIPKTSTVAVEVQDRTVEPDFALRNLHWYNRFQGALADDVLWWLRIGLNDGYSLLGASYHTHGMRAIHGNSTMQENHPEYFALVNGERVTDYRGTGHACFSSEGLFQETVNYLRAAFDHFDEPAMDLWPQDAYHHCSCELCAGKSPSDAVFGFVDRVARELLKTHPDRLITCGAYAEYVDPPASIEKFSPNVAIFLANRGRPRFDVPARWQTYWDQVSAWQEKLAPGRILRVENNLYNQNAVMHPRAYAKDLQALKGVSMGEFNEVPRGNPGSSQWPNIGINHLNYYVNARLLWDADQDIDALLDDYYRNFYGPAAEAMQEALEFAEQSYTRFDGGRESRPMLDLPARLTFVEKLHAAQKQVEGTLYGRRIQAILDDLPPIGELQTQLMEQQAEGNPRETAPVAVALHKDADAEPETYRFSPLVAYANRDTALPLTTSFTVQWDDEALYFDILCNEPDMANLEVGDEVWEGDSILLFIETPKHSHYMIQVDPDGRVFDADRLEFGRLLPAWSSLVEVETEKGQNFWRVQLRVPLAVIADNEDYGDPIHYVVAPQPGDGDEWFFNIGRTRMRDGERTTGEQGYTPFAFSKSDEPMHLVEKFVPSHFSRLLLKKEIPADSPSH